MLHHIAPTAGTKSRFTFSQMSYAAAFPADALLSTT